MTGQVRSRVQTNPAAINYTVFSNGKTNRFCPQVERRRANTNGIKVGFMFSKKFSSATVCAISTGIKRCWRKHSLSLGSIVLFVYCLGHLEKPGGTRLRAHYGRDIERESPSWWPSLTLFLEFQVIPGGSNQFAFNCLIKPQSRWTWASIHRRSYPDRCASFRIINSSISLYVFNNLLINY